MIIKVIKKIHYISIFFTFVISCSTFKDAGKVLRNEKVKTTDEFLVKKREPLVLPPNYEKIPEPGTILKDNVNEEEKIKKILKVPKTEGNLNNKASSAEESILKKINK